MMQQLGITALRPSRNADESKPNPANYDEAQANPYPKLPELMTLKSGAKVTTKAQWETRRKEIMEDFEREVVGRIRQRAEGDVDRRRDGDHDHRLDARARAQAGRPRGQLDTPTSPSTSR